MINSYVSIVLPRSECDDLNELLALDQWLTNNTFHHELVFYEASNDPALIEVPSLSCAVSVVQTLPSTRDDEMEIAGLGRAVGDIVVLLRQPSARFLASMDGGVLEDVLRAASTSSELVGVVERGRPKTALGTMMFRLITFGRKPVPRFIAIAFSRRSLQRTLGQFPQTNSIDITAARALSPTDVLFTWRGDTPTWSRLEQFRFAVRVLLHTTGVVTVIQSVVVLLSMLVGLIGTCYALAVFLAGSAPEGWVTLLSFLGISQTALSVSLMLIWRKLQALQAQTLRSIDRTFNVDVFPPSMRD